MSIILYIWLAPNTTDTKWENISVNCKLSPRVAITYLQQIGAPLYLNPYYAVGKLLVAPNRPI